MKNHSTLHTSFAGLFFGRIHSVIVIMVMVIVAPLSAGADVGDKGKAETKVDVETAARVGKEVKFFASDEMEGRGPRTKGLVIAGEYIRDEFKRLGLKSGVADGSFYQPFPVLPGQLRLLQKKCSLTITGPADAEMSLEMGKTYQPMQTGLAANQNAAAKAELVFIGYGISAEDLKYDDYAGVDVEGKILVMIRREPQQDDEESVFDGKKDSAHAAVIRKLQLARQKKAAAVILVNDPHTAPAADQDDLEASTAFFGRRRGFFRRRNQPNAATTLMAQVKQSVVNDILAKSPLKTKDGAELASLAAIEEHIDKTFEPVSQSLGDWSAELKLAMEGSIITNNVVGVLEGEGSLADETIVIGAHYDHLGMGEFGSRAPGRREVHNGADDNATGTVALIELARRFAAAEKKPARRMVFIGFSGEERGLIGSRYYCDNPLFPLEKTAAMINFDMVGRLRNNNLQLHAAATAAEFGEIATKLGEGAQVNAVPQPGFFSGSDHAPFGRKEIPCIFFFTGMTEIYHTPEDDYETINIEGLVKVINYSEKFIHEVVNLPEKPKFVPPRGRSRPPRTPVLGIQLSVESEGKGALIERVLPDSPAQKAGLVTGDRIIDIDGAKIDDLQGLRNVLRGKKANDKVKVLARRGEEEVKVEVTLAAPSR